jgi:hypothetical protein
MVYLSGTVSPEREQVEKVEVNMPKKKKKLRGISIVCKPAPVDMSKVGKQVLKVLSSPHADEQTKVEAIKGLTAAARPSLENVRISDCSVVMGCNE